MERANNMENNNNPTVSIVIVCMNNPKNLYPCLESIKKYTQVSYECFVVVYLFTKENLQKVKADFPWVKFIESNEIRGFSENNNLALRKVKGKYCFVLNDDTEIRMSAVDKLVESFSKCPENTAIVSPVTIFPDGKVQVCGVPPIKWYTSLLELVHLWNRNKQKKYVGKVGLFKSYNIIGAAFLIKTDIFKSVGWFDEKYFFCPEDIALSTKLNDLGYECWVNNDIKVIHYEGMSGKSTSLVSTATKPAARRGSLLFFSNGNRLAEITLATLYSAITCFVCVLHFVRGVIKKRPNQYSVLAQAELNVIKNTYSRKTPKEIFTHYFRKIRK